MPDSDSYPTKIPFIPFGSSFFRFAFRICRYTLHSNFLIWRTYDFRPVHNSNGLLPSFNDRVGNLFLMYQAVTTASPQSIVGAFDPSNMGLTISISIRFIQSDT